MKEFLKQFFIGWGSIFDFSGNYYNIKIKSDSEALADDWKKVGQDMFSVLQKDK